ncbi:hypothetical protein [Marinobacter salarius]|uniref:Disulfide isomerase/thiol-disulfide oxidase n=1 Tax=Marinobacter salarius TaxID=1420917 RepID=A0A1W6KFW2_9GAMM|nr:hypothetical protein [Marinobacter salarius]ARM86316.1 disulfide isomerase/thiol-disulfide oxidase [Marinobacter salarius]
MSIHSERRIPFSKMMRVALLAGSVSLLGASPIAVAQDSLAQPDIAIKAVQATLPSVAILGQKSGPANTTEVFIQVPGVLNMQSVYVLGDGKTVISGVVVPPVSNGFPGSELTLPDGNASVDPRAPRQGVDQINKVLGITPEARTKQFERARSAQTREFSVPALPRSAKDVVETDDAQQAEGVKPEGVPAPQMASAALAGTPERAGSASEETNSALASSAKSEAHASESQVIESLSDVAETGAFSDAVRTMLMNDSDIQRLRGLEGTVEQPAEYLELVKTLPSVKQGDAPKSIYVMFDPNCPVCHRYYSELQPMIRAGALEVNWIPAIVFPDNRSSLTSSAALLAELQREGGDAGSMMKAMMTENGYTAKIDDAPNVDRLVPYLQPVVKNTALMAMVKATTPLVVFENTDGELAVNAGIPQAGYEELIRPDNG